MSYYIATELAILPDRIISVGYDNNVFPQDPVRHEIPRTDLELEYIAKDLVSGSIQPEQKFWKNVQAELRDRYTYADMDNKEKVKEAVLVMMERYHNELLKGIKPSVFMSRDKLPTCFEYYYLLRDYAKREGLELDNARAIVGQWTGEQWLEYFKGK